MRNKNDIPALERKGRTIANIKEINMAKKFLFGMLAVLLAFGLVISCAEPFLEDYSYKPVASQDPDTTGLEGKWYFNNPNDPVPLVAARNRQIGYITFESKGKTYGDFTYTFDDVLNWGLRSFSGTYSVSGDIVKYDVKSILLSNKYEPAVTGASPKPEVNETGTVNIFKPYDKTSEYYQLLVKISQVEEPEVIEGVLYTYDDAVWALVQIALIEENDRVLAKNFDAALFGLFYDYYVADLEAAFKEWLIAEIMLFDPVAYDTSAKAEAGIPTWKSTFLTQINNNVNTDYNTPEMDSWLYPDGLKLTTWEAVEAFIMRYGTHYGSNAFGFKYSTPFRMGGSGGATIEFLKTSRLASNINPRAVYGSGYPAYLNERANASPSMIGADDSTAPTGTIASGGFNGFIDQLLELFDSDAIDLEAENTSNFFLNATGISPTYGKAGLLKYNSFMFEKSKDAVVPANVGHLLVRAQRKVINPVATQELDLLYGTPNAATVRFYKAP